MNEMMERNTYVLYRACPLILAMGSQTIKCNPRMRSHLVTLMGKKGRQKWKKVPHPKKHITAVQSPLHTRAVQPVADPSIWDDLGDQVHEHDQGPFHPLPLPNSLASAFM
jgi:hypothetical protein